LRFDGRAEALRSQGVLTLQVDADGVEMILGKVFHGEGTVGALSLLVCSAQRQIGRVRMDKRETGVRVHFNFAKPAESRL